ncbi:MAG: family 20 glycosylhydrolase [Algoriphagus sp.]|uniref:family 20 glycosylhydrolase n=1 Tax=Algoriphagus sp. TaxID=1872435 RepID=UPI002628D361|nr:family 20 glycosylhydrolase [Algoriphagus sp.]MDG1276609.1 family 20 glycosylhydrolase [Algoriphagus sp.]
MKKLSLLVLAILFLVNFSCQKKEKITAVFDLLPSPKVMSLSRSTELSPRLIQSEFELAKASFIDGKGLESFEGELIQFELDPNLIGNTEAYQLDLFDDEVKIKAQTEVGLWNALMTLGQVIQDALDQDVNLPGGQIFDEPALAYRAVHLDVKHHLEKKEYYFELMDRLASLKINAIIIEIEDKLTYELQPKVGSSDAFSIAEWKEIADYAMARNIRMSPLVQGLGHASFILKHPEYLDLRDDPESDWAFNPLNEKTYQVQFDLYTDALKAFPHANYLHVGGDEVNTTGRNSGKSALELQLLWLNRVSEYAATKGLKPIFWDDMPLKNAELYGTIYNRELTSSQVDSIWAAKEENLNKYIDLFPKNCVYMRWNYDMPESPGNAKAMNWFTSNGFEVMGATAGQTRWNLMPQEQSNAQNIRDFALSSIENKTSGLLLTLWDDDSPHFELYQRGIATFAEYTWSGGTRSIAEVHQSFIQRQFGADLASVDLAFIDDLEAPVDFWKNALLDGKDRNRLRKLTDPVNQALIKLPNPDSAGVWTSKYKEKLTKAELSLSQVDLVLERIAESKKLANRNIYTLEVYEQVAQAVQFSNRALITLAELDDPSGEKRAMAEQKLAGMAEEWNAIQSNLEAVYGKTRSLNKPADYILDQDHHVHLANQAKGFSDWQFYVEKLFLEKIAK